MPIRKIQVIAGTTYSISLPKDWIIKNKLKEKNEISITENKNGTLTIHPDNKKENTITSANIKIDEFITNIDQVIYSLYYMGIEEITLFSPKELTKQTRNTIRKTLETLSGAEISFEDKQKITIKILLDRTKVKIPQLLYRIALIIDSSLSTITEKFELNEIKLNEKEIDRLYHLISKTLNISLQDANILQTSEIKNSTLIISYFLLSKRLENIADSVNYLAEYLNQNKKTIKIEKELIENISKELSQHINHLLSKKTTPEKIKKNYEISTEDETIQKHIRDIIRYLTDIEEEIFHITFYNQIELKNHSILTS